MKARAILFLCLSGVILWACRSSDGTDETLPDEPLIELRMEEKVEKDNAFALDLFKTAYANTRDANLFLSPLSVSMALNMILNGAAGATADEMKTALRAEGYTSGQLSEYSRTLRQTLTEADPATEVNIVNSIWYRDGFPVKDAFLDVNRTYFDAEVAALDFASPSALTTINNWCAAQTKDKIKTIIDEIPEEAVMYLVNAVYFKGIWKTEFDRNSTVKGYFYPETGAQTQVDLMRQEETYPYTSDETAEWLEAPYGNEAFSMVLILPRRDKTVADVIDLLDSDMWNRKMTELAGVRRKMQLFLPRFKVECKYGLQEKILPDMGMKLPFLIDAADFSGIANIGQPLYLSKVIHKTFVEVNEEGAEAAAVTSGGMATAESAPGFFVDKPFLFAIREQSTGVILFIGKIGEIK
ncbi:MAG: serpin family protein [Tannerella sp.]|jgi:serpin B|nr:serpin family protein [Tannerella sp.]